MTIESSITSLVVPGISETIALSSFSREFNNVDLPELGFPTIAIGMPFLITLPRLNESASLSASSFTLTITELSSFLSANSTSSSPKSSSSSINEANLKSSDLNLAISDENPPRI